MFSVTFSVAPKGAPLGEGDRSGVQPRLPSLACVSSLPVLRSRFGQRHFVRLCDPRRSIAVSLFPRPSCRSARASQGRSLPRPVPGLVQLRAFRWPEASL